MRDRRVVGLIATAAVLAGCSSTTAPPAADNPAPTASTGVLEIGPVREFTAANLTFAVPRSWRDGMAVARSMSRRLGPPGRPQGAEIAIQAPSGYGLTLTRVPDLTAGAADGTAVQLPAELLGSSDMGWPAGAWAAESQADNGVLPVVLTVVAPDKATAEAVAGSFQKADGQ